MRRLIYVAEREGSSFARLFQTTQRLALHMLSKRYAEEDVKRQCPKNIVAHPISELTSNSTAHTNTR